MKELDERKNKESLENKASENIKKKEYSYVDEARVAGGGIMAAASGIITICSSSILYQSIVAKDYDSVIIFGFATGLTSLITLAGIGEVYEGYTGKKFMS